MSRFRRQLLWFAGGGAVLLVFVALFGNGGVGQFSPVTFECRGVKTFHIPYTDVLLWTSPREPYRPRIVQFWIDEGYLKPEPGPTEHWHMITGWVSWRCGHSSGYAKSFWYFADCNSDEKADVWIAWSRRHPELAADLWPRVIVFLQRAAQSQLPDACYGAAAFLMAHVQNAEDEKTYHERVAEWRKDYADVIADAQ